MKGGYTYSYTTFKRKVGSQDRRLQKRQIVLEERTCVTAIVVLFTMLIYKSQIRLPLCRSTIPKERVRVQFHSKHSTVESAISWKRDGDREGFNDGIVLDCGRQSRSMPWVVRRESTTEV